MNLRELKTGISLDEVKMLIPGISVFKKDNSSYISNTIEMNGRTCKTDLKFEENKLISISGIFSESCDQKVFNDFTDLYLELVIVNSGLYGKPSEEKIYNSDYRTIDTKESRSSLITGNPEYRFIDIARASWDNIKENFTSYILLSIEPDWSAHLKFENRIYKPFHIV